MAGILSRSPCSISSIILMLVLAVTAADGDFDKKEVIDKERGLSSLDFSSLGDSSASSIQSASGIFLRLRMMK